MAIFKQIAITLGMTVALAACSDDAAPTATVAASPTVAVAASGAPATPQAIPAAAQSSDQPTSEALGKRAFNKCAACHTVDEGGRNGLGPNLWNVVGNSAASVEGFSYSSALSSSGLTWTRENLDQYLTNPRAFLPGNKMAFAGIRQPEERENLLAFLAAQSND